MATRVQESLTPVIAHAVPFVAGEKCSHHHSHRRSRTPVTTCQASDSEHLVDRRQLLGAGISLAAAVQLRSASPAAALVVSKEWEKVPQVICFTLEPIDRPDLEFVSLQVNLPVDPGVVLLDIAFTGTDANHGT